MLDWYKFYKNKIFPTELMWDWYMFYRNKNFSTEVMGLVQALHRIDIILQEQDISYSDKYNQLGLMGLVQVLHRKRSRLLFF
jgi:hypothetical protein